MKADNNNSKIYRLIDANLNRLQEGLRVIEDTLRFVYDEDKLYLENRALRHNAKNIVGRIYPKMILSRDSCIDPGKKIKEFRRKNIRELLISNYHRCEEALRVLEEYSRLISANAGRQLKTIRYKLYDLEKRVFKIIRKC